MSTNRPEEEWDLPPTCPCPPPYETVRGLCETCGGVVPKDTPPPTPKKKQRTKTQETRAQLQEVINKVRDTRADLKGIKTHLLSNINRARLATAIRSLDIILEDDARGCP